MLIDGTGVSFGPFAQWNLTAVRYFKGKSILNDCYPENGVRIHVVNAPAWVGYVWRLIIAMGMVPQRSLKKFRFFSVDEKAEALEAILEVCDRSQVPQYLGGDK